jgi:hypothetical protein
MTEAKIEVLLQRAREKYSLAKTARIGVHPAGYWLTREDAVRLIQTYVDHYACSAPSAM